MNKVHEFEHENFGKIRALLIEGIPWFVGADIARFLQYANPAGAIRSMVDEEDITTLSGFSAHSDGLIFINEAGLYDIVLHSHKLEKDTRKQFLSWVSDKVIPSMYNEREPDKPSESKKINSDKLTLFSNGMFEAIRAIMSDDVPLFVGLDVAKALDYKNPNEAVREHVRDKHKQTVKVQTPGGAQNVIMIDEPGVYSLIFRSKQERAEQFTDWVYSEVLPALRRTGQYSMGQHNFKLTKTDYFKAMRMVSSARPERIPYLVDGFRNIGLDIPEISEDMRKKLAEDYTQSRFRRNSSREMNTDKFRDTTDELALILRDVYRREISFTRLSEKTGVNRSCIYKYMWGTQKPIEKEVRQRLIDAANALIALADSHAPAQ